MSEPINSYLQVIDLKTAKAFINEAVSPGRWTLRGLEEHAAHWWSDEKRQSLKSPTDMKIMIGASWVLLYLRGLLS